MIGLRFSALFVALLVAAACFGTNLSDKANGARTKPTWRDLPGVDGKKHSLDNLSQDVVVVAITCNHCPVAMEYFGRLKEFTQQLCGPGGKVALVAVSLSNLETDKLPRMQQLAEREGFNFPYLHDESQEVGKQLGATATPQFFVLNKERSIVYRGAWDDDLNVAKVKKRHVEDAVKAVLDGKMPLVPETRAIGCAIVYDK
jgi:peroxiredoxin